MCGRNARETLSIHAMRTALPHRSTSPFLSTTRRRDDSTGEKWSGSGALTLALAFGKESSSLWRPRWRIDRRGTTRTRRVCIRVRDIIAFVHLSSIQNLERHQFSFPLRHRHLDASLFFPTDAQSHLRCRLRRHLWYGDRYNGQTARRLDFPNESVVQKDLSNDVVTDRCTQAASSRSGEMGGDTRRDRRLSNSSRKKP